MSSKSLSNSTIRNNSNGKLNAIPAIQATGGSISTIVADGVRYRLHSFTSTGANTFTITYADPGAKCEALLIGGGGGGLNGFGPGARWGGGGGAGGVVMTSFDAIIDTYDMQVGSGSPRGSGAGSTFNRVRSSGIIPANQSWQIGAATGGNGGLGSGASGGGQRYENSQPNAQAQGIYGQGFDGANPGWASGGAGGPGLGYGSGGPGVTLNFTGTSVTYASGNTSGSFSNAPLNPHIGGGGRGTYPPGAASGGTNGAIYIRYQI